MERAIKKARGADGADAYEGPKTRSRVVPPIAPPPAEELDRQEEDMSAGEVESEGNSDSTETQQPPSEQGRNLQGPEGASAPDRESPSRRRLLFEPPVLPSAMGWMTNQPAWDWRGPPRQPVPNPYRAPRLDYGEMEMGGWPRAPPPEIPYAEADGAQWRTRVVQQTHQLLDHLRLAQRPRDAPTQRAVGVELPGQDAQPLPGPQELDAVVTELIGELEAMKTGSQSRRPDSPATENRKLKAALEALETQHAGELQRVARQHKEDIKVVSEECQRWRERATAPTPPPPPPTEMAATAAAPAGTPGEWAKEVLQDEEEEADSELDPPSSGRKRGKREKHYSSSSSDDNDDSRGAEEYDEEEEDPVTPFVIARNPWTSGRRGRAFFLPAATAMRRGRELQIPTYDGRDQRFVDWLYRFEAAASLRRLTQADLGTLLLGRLKGEPSMLCKRIKSIGRPYTNVRNDVYNAITGAVTQATAQEQWRVMRRAPGDSVVLYLERLKDQAAIAYPGLENNDELLYLLVKEKFMQSTWTGTGPARWLKWSDPKDWTELRRQAGLMESFATEGQTPATVASITPGVDQQVPGPIDLPLDGPSPTASVQRQDNNSNALSGGNKKPRSRKNKSNGSEGQNQTPSKKGGQGTSQTGQRTPRKRHCAVCGKDNHWTDQCYQFPELLARKAGDAPKESSNQEN